MNNKLRYVAMQSLAAMGSVGYVMKHELWRIRLYEDGLTEKELAYAKKLDKDLEDVLKRMTRLREKLQRTTKGPY